MYVGQVADSPTRQRKQGKLSLVGQILHVLVRGQVTHGTVHVAKLILGNLFSTILRISTLEVRELLFLTDCIMDARLQTSVVVGKMLEN